MIFKMGDLFFSVCLSCARGNLLNMQDHHGDLAEDVAETHGHNEVAQLLRHERIRIEYYE